MPLIDILRAVRGQRLKENIHAYGAKYFSDDCKEESKAQGEPDPEVAAILNSPELSLILEQCARAATPSGGAGLSQNPARTADSASASNNPWLSPSGKVLPDNLIAAETEGVALASVKDRRFKRAFQRYIIGGNLWRDEVRAVEYVIQFKVSYRTAQRHAKRGTVPAAERKPGMDGKMHPVGKGRRQRSKVERELLLARQALARATRALASGSAVGVDERALFTETRAALEALAEQFDSRALVYAA